MATDYMYKTGTPWLKKEEMREEIKQGKLRATGRGDPTAVEVGLPRNDKVRAREATASLSGCRRARRESIEAGQP
ncbi:hypothetical protein NL676_029034 [Syzygium grande]|nr:hypothetical protein NL676_029034 [Syzygium grande]